MEGKNKNTILNFILFTQLSNWSSYALLGKNIIYTQKYPFEKIGSFLKRNKTQVKIQDGVIYKRATIRVNGNGISLRDELDGREIGTKNQFLIKTDQFLLSKIDARNGAFGVVPPELNNGVITGNFWTFDVDYSKVNPHYLTLLMGTKRFQELSQTASVGTTNRNYLQEAAFLNFEIPFPTLEEQGRIVNDYNEKIERAKELERESRELEKGIDKNLFEWLGIQNISNKKEKRILNLVGFANIVRWDTLFILGSLPCLTAKFELKTFSQIITSLNKDRFGKSIRVDSSKHPNNNYLYIGMEHVEKETGRLLDLPKVKGWDIKSQTLQVPKNFFIYGKLRPYLNKYWINNTEHENIICSSEFFVFDIQKDINKLFFKYVLSSKFIQDQITDKTSGARMPRINEDIFLNLQFPLPPIEIQNDISKCITESKEKIEENFKLIDIIKKQAHDEFEKEIFNH